MKKITKGNDFTMRIPVCKMEGGEAIPYPLPACTDIVVNLVNAFRRRPLSFTIDVANDNIIHAKVEDNLPCATYTLEVKGKCLGNDWRSNEYEQIQIVDNNASADYDFSELQEGENSVDMNTAIIILALPVELSGLIADTKATLTQAEETIRKANDATEESKEARKLANTALEQMKTKIDACTTATAAAENATKECKKATDKAVADCQQAVKDAQVAIDYDSNTYSLIIATGTEE